MNELRRLTQEKFDDVMFLSLIMFIPMIMILFTSFLLMQFLGNHNDILDLFQTWLAMGISFIVIPLMIISKKYHIKMGDIGIAKISVKEMVIGFILLILLYLYIGEKASLNTIMLLSLQTLAVAVSEEVWARGILFFIIRKLTSNKVLIVLLSSFIFTFLIHANRGVINNLLYRLPGAILMGLAYERTGKLHYSVLIHYIYNMIAII